MDSKTTRTVPDRDAIARAIYARGFLTRHQAERAADAVLAGLASQPTVAEARAQALEDAAERAAPDLANEVGGHTSTYSVRHWLRGLAARERGERT